MADIRADINDAFRNLMTHGDLLQPFRRKPAEAAQRHAGGNPVPQAGSAAVASGLPGRGRDAGGLEVQAGVLDLNAMPAVQETRIPTLPPRALQEYETLWTRLTSLRLSPPSVLLTSCVHGEGVTTTAVQVARCAGAKDRAVLVVDLDFERGGASGLVPKAREGADLRAVLRGECTLEDAIHFVEPDRFFLLTLDVHGTETPALLDTPEMEGVLKTLASSFDMLLFDAPPCFYAESAQRMASRVGGVILLSRQEGHEKRMLEKAARKLAHANGHLLGQVQTFLK